MRNFTLSLCLLISPFLAGAQVIYISTSSNNLYRLNMDDCSTGHVIQINQTTWDISFDPQGNLFGISDEGSLFLIDTTTGHTTEVHDFNGQEFNSMTIRSDGIIFTMGNEGELWSYNFSTDQAAYVGDIGFDATGDLTFYRGQLYAAVTGDRIVQIDLSQPHNSHVIINDDTSESIYGIVSDFVSCTEVNVYAITGGLSNIYRINFEESNLDLVCELNFEVYGGASTTEFLNSSVLMITDSLLQDANCKNQDGEITLYTTGGFGTVEFSLNNANFQDQPFFSSLASGTYQVIAEDQIGCRDTAVVSLSMSTGPQVDTIITWPSGCSIDNGSFLVEASGGLGPYLFSMDSLFFQSSGLFDSMAAGRYTVLVVDAAGCVVWDETVVDSLQAAGIIVATVDHTTCGEPNGSILMASDAGNGTYSLDGVTFNTANQFLALAAGDYTVTLKDSNGCLDAVSVHVNSSNLPVVELIHQQPEHCGQSNGLIEVQGKDGAAPYEYSIDGLVFQLHPVYPNLSAGIYTIHILDDNGCINTASVTLPANAGFEIASINTTPTLCGEESGAVAISIAGDVNQVQLWVNDELYPSATAIEGLASGGYTAVLIDANGCRTDTAFTIDRTGCPIYIPNVFSPNRDGINDFFRIETGDKVPVTIRRFFIFDRWGNNVYTRYNFDIHEEDGWWDGTFKRFTMDPGVFAYYIEAEFEHGDREVYKGNVTLIR